MQLKTMHFTQIYKIIAKGVENIILKLNMKIMSFSSFPPPHHNTTPPQKKKHYLLKSLKLNPPKKIAHLRALLQKTDLKISGPRSWSQTRRGPRDPKVGDDEAMTPIIIEIPSIFFMKSFFLRGKENSTSFLSPPFFIENGPFSKFRIQKRALQNVNIKLQIVLIHTILPVHLQDRALVGGW